MIWGIFFFGFVQLIKPQELESINKWLDQKLRYQMIRKIHGK